MDFDKEIQNVLKQKEKFLRETEPSDNAPKNVLKERVCFRISHDFDEKHILVVLAAIQTYITDTRAKTASWNKLYRDNRKHELELYVIVPNGWNWIKLFEINLEGVSVFEKETALQRGLLKIDLYDYYVFLSLEKCLRIVRAGDLHLCSGLGALIGCDAKSLPKLFVSHQTSPFSRTVLVCFGSGWSSVKERVDKIVSECEYSPVAIPLPLYQDAQRYIDLIAKASYVIGNRNFLTYAASSLHKSVLEITESSIDFKLLTQWANKQWVPVSGFGTASKAEQDRLLMIGIQRLLSTTPPEENGDPAMYHVQAEDVQ